ncbi:class A beta-lactamase-related serine hydrolase [Brachybacterium muris]|uniref:serine hydrolase n=1 Tax=Brachybacterium muris TaxID=219301 RepID=UPI00223AED51|nr:serine hydrolase [Brachybacterium muris]MCT2260314.1 class A beta-lactamase-related serine hydrolase [Brachybacterium muris]
MTLPWSPSASSAVWSIAVSRLGDAPSAAVGGDSPDDAPVEGRASATDPLLLEQDPQRMLGTASLGKLFLLRAVAERIDRDPETASLLLPRPEGLEVEDSGLWWHLAAPRLAVNDLAVLVASCSDNLAANALIDWIGLQAVQDVARQWVPGGSTLCDFFRDHRGPEHPPEVSIGCAQDYLQVMEDVARATTPALATMRSWLRTGVDHSLVAAAARLDPLSHYHPHGLDCVNKTGCDVGVRADVGVLTSPVGALAYAVIASWGTSAEQESAELVIEDMRRLGGLLVAHLDGAHAVR